MKTLEKSDPVAVAVTAAIHAGNVSELNRLLSEHPDLATARIGEQGGRSLLHIATDWPGHFPNVAATATALIAAGADVNGHCSGCHHEETPLHWAASSDDLAVLDVLLDHGADIEVKGGVIGDGTPLADAVAFGQWQAARRLIERGAQSNLWQSAALGLMDRVEKHFAAAPSAEDITNAFWCACHGSQRVAAEYLLKRGADLNWIGYDELTPLDTARRSGADQLAAWLVTQGAKSTSELR